MLLSVWWSCISTLFILLLILGLWLLRDDMQPLVVALPRRFSGHLVRNLDPADLFARLLLFGYQSFERLFLVARPLSVVPFEHSCEVDLTYFRISTWRASDVRFKF